MANQTPHPSRPRSSKAKHLQAFDRDPLRYIKQGITRENIQKANIDELDAISKKIGDRNDWIDNVSKKKK